MLQELGGADGSGLTIGSISTSTRLVLGFNMYTPFGSIKPNTINDYTISQLNIVYTSRDDYAVSSFALVGDTRTAVKAVKISFPPFDFSLDYTVVSYNSNPSSTIYDTQELIDQQRAIFMYFNENVGKTVPINIELIK